MYKLLLKLNVTGYKDTLILEDGKSLGDSSYGILAQSECLECIKMIESVIINSATLLNYCNKVVKSKEQKNSDLKIYISNKIKNQTREIRLVNEYLANFNNSEFIVLFESSSKVMVHEVYKLLDTTTGNMVEIIYYLNEAVKNPSLFNCRKLSKLSQVYKLESNKLVKVFIKIEDDGSFKSEIVEGSLKISDRDMCVSYNNTKGFECVMDCNCIEDAMDFIENLRSKNLDKISLIKML